MVPMLLQASAGTGLWVQPNTPLFRGGELSSSAARDGHPRGPALQPRETPFPGSGQRGWVQGGQNRGARRDHGRSTTQTPQTRPPKCPSTPATQQERGVRGGRCGLRPALSPQCPPPGHPSPLAPLTRGFPTDLGVQPGRDEDAERGGNFQPIRGLVSHSAFTLWPLSAAL